MELIKNISKWWRYRQPLVNKPRNLQKEQLKIALTYWQQPMEDIEYTGLCNYLARTFDGIDVVVMVTFLRSNDIPFKNGSYIDERYKPEPRVELLEELIARWDL